MSETTKDDGAFDWKKAEEHLKDVESAYTEIGRAGLFALTISIIPARERFNSGERTAELYSEIMGISL